MRYQCIVLAFVIMTGCSGSRSNENTATDAHDSTANRARTGRNEGLIKYIGYIAKFDDNNTFYTDLYFSDDFNYDEYDALTKMGDQVVFSDEEIRRTRFDINKAGKYFDLTGLKEIEIFDGNCVKLTSGRLSHVEYFEDLIESRFVAVFQVDNPEVSNPLFCVGGTGNDLAQIEFTPYQDEQLKAQLIDRLNLDPALIWQTEHYKSVNGVTYTGISADTIAYIIATMNSEQTILYKSKTNEMIMNITAISWTINHHPVLLIECGMAETDMWWSSLLVFNGTEYEPYKHQRIIR